MNPSPPTAVQLDALKEVANVGCGHAASALSQLVGGHQVRIAHDAASGLQLARSFLPELILLDIGMPGEDGYSLLQQVRSLPSGRNADIPAMALTAYVRGEDRVKAIRAGFHMHATKPVDPAELIAAVANLGRLRTRA